VVAMPALATTTILLYGIFIIFTLPIALMGCCHGRNLVDGKKVKDVFCAVLIVLLVIPTGTTKMND